MLARRQSRLLERTRGAGAQTAIRPQIDADGDRSSLQGSRASNPTTPATRSYSLPGAGGPFENWGRPSVMSYQGAFSLTQM